MLRSLLHFAETGKLGAGDVGEGYDSPFEEAVARVIRENGYHVHSQVGVSGFRIDLGVIDPIRPGEYILGVECDGATYHSSRSARDRDRLRQEVLEGRGWRLHRIWSTDWFRHPQQATDRLLAAIRSVQQRGMSKATYPPDESEDEVIFEADRVTEQDEPVHVDVDQVIKRSFVREYEPCSLSVPCERNILELTSVEVGRLAISVVEAEGPVHTEEVARRIREAFGLQRTGNRILERIRSNLLLLSQNGRLSREGEFWSIPGRALQSVRSRRTAPLPLKKASTIAPAEYQLAIMEIFAEVVAISRAELLVETAGLFGFERTGPDLKNEIDRQASELIRKGLIIEDGDVLRTAFPSKSLTTTQIFKH